MEDFRLNKEEGFDPSKYNVLVVEDSHTTRILLGEMIKKIGYYFELVENGEDALKRVVNEQLGFIDAILLDIGLPGVSGIEVCEEIKKNEASKNIPVIFLTASGDEAQIQRALDAGGNDFMLKSPHLIELQLRLKNAIKATEQQEVISGQDQLMSEILAIVPDVIYKISYDGKVLEISESAEEIMGFKRKDLIGKMATETFIDEHVRKKVLSLLLEEGKIENHEIRIKHKERYQKKVSVNAILKRDEFGNPESIIGTMRQIKDRILPICSYCDNVRRNISSKKWEPLNKNILGEFLLENGCSGSHGICPDCLKKEFPDFDIQKNK